MIRRTGIEVQSINSGTELANLDLVSKVRTSLLLSSSILFLVSIYPPAHLAFFVAIGAAIAGLSTLFYTMGCIHSYKKRTRQAMKDFMASGAAQVLANAAILAASIRQDMYMGEDKTMALSVEATILDGVLQAARVVGPTLVPGSVECVLVVDGGIEVTLLDSEDKSLKWRVMEIARERIPGSEIAFRYN